MVFEQDGKWFVFIVYMNGFRTRESVWWGDEDQLWSFCPGRPIPSRCFVSSCYFIVVSRCVFLIRWLICFCALFFMFGTIFSLLLGVFVRALVILVKVYLFLFVVYCGHIVHLVLWCVFNKICLLLKKKVTKEKHTKLICKNTNTRMMVSINFILFI
jgi:hypothetical protein